MVQTTLTTCIADDFRFSIADFGSEASVEVSIQNLTTAGEPVIACFDLSVNEARRLAAMLTKVAALAEVEQVA